MKKRFLARIFGGILAGGMIFSSIGTTVYAEEYVIHFDFTEIAEEEEIPEAPKIPTTDITETPEIPTTYNHDIMFNPLRTGDKITVKHSEKFPASLSGTITIKKDMFQIEDERNKLDVNFSDITYGAELPEWQEKWDSFPEIEFADTEPVAFKSGNRTRLEVFNAYEVERMIRTIYITAADNPDLWKDKALTIPNFTIKVCAPEDFSSNNFYPWRGGVSVEGKVKPATGGNTFYIYALDIYLDGNFKDTEYWCWK
jgi:hypothetical protein